MKHTRTVGQHRWKHKRNCTCEPCQQLRGDPGECPNCTGPAYLLETKRSYSLRCEWCDFRERTRKAEFHGPE